MNLAKYPHVHIDTISYCNSKCIFCGYHNMRRAKGIMPRVLFNKIIDEIATWDTKVSVNPHHYGELFLHPEWFELLNYIQDKAPKTDITISTNASVLDDAKLDKLITIKNLRSICFSAYSDNPDTYTKIIGLPPDTLNTLEHAAYRLSKERPDVELVLGVAPILLSAEEYTSFVAHWVQLGIPATIIPHVIIYMHTNSSSTSSGCMEPCPDPFDILVVLHNGDTCGCQIDLDGENYFGNAYNNSLLEIWNGERANDYRNMHLQNKRDESPLCRSCTRPCDAKRFIELYNAHTTEVKSLI